MNQLKNIQFLQLADRFHIMKIAAFLLFFVASVSFANADDGILQSGKTVTVFVKDAIGEVVGANVSVKGTTIGNITDADGKVVLQNISNNSILIVSYVGYKPQEVLVGGQSTINVLLQEDTQALEEVVVVGYGQQRVATVTGAVSQVKTDKITVAPQVNVTHTLAGQLPGLISKQTSGVPGSDDAALNIRGFGDPLVIVDGIETNINSLDATQIETVSILKDGAASIYGSRAGNGVILVTTKRGSQSKPMVTVNTSLTFQGSANVIKPGSSAQRAQYASDVWRNSENADGQLPYTDEEIRKYAEGNDPNYLNTDWYGAVIRSLAPQQNHNVSLSGGTDRIKYFGYFGYNTQETILKKNGGHFDRYNFQANMEAKVTSQLSLLFDLQHFREQRYYPSGCDAMTNNANFWQDMIYNASPFYALSLPDDSYLAYAGISYGSPLFATNSDLCGYQDRRSKTSQFRGELKYDFKYLTGLNAKGTIIYRNNDSDSKSVKKQGQFYTYDSATDVYTYMRSSQDPTGISMGYDNTTKIVQQYSLNYNNTFNDAHTVTGLLMYEWQKTAQRSFSTSRSGFESLILDEFFAGDPSTASNSSSTYHNGRVAWIGRLNYSYLDRYMIEGIFRADASSRFADGHRWGYFPSISAGWNIAKEDFLRSSDLFDNLKLRLSYGSSGYDAVADFNYLTGYSYDATYTINGNLLSGLNSTGLANVNLTWEKMHIYNAGLDFSLMKRKLYGEIEGFYRKRTGIPGTRANSLPTTFGASLPQENLNSQSTKGFEFRLGTAGRAGGLMYDVSANISYSRSKWIDYDEAVYTDQDEIRLYKKSGQYTDVRMGYVFDGLFTNQAEIDGWGLTYDVLNNDNSSLRPGDAKYKDLNGDGVINWRDQKEIGKGALPHWMYGANLNLKYRNFDFSALLQGAFGYTTYITLSSAAITTYYENYWDATRNNKADALESRPGGNATVDWLYSDYRNHNTFYLRLKNMSIGYELPMALINRVGLGKVRVYIAGTNLLTLTNIKKYNVDPEMTESYGAGVNYPQQYTLSAGLNITF